jgi:hypothetical protein
VAVEAEVVVLTVVLRAQVAQVVVVTVGTLPMVRLAQRTLVVVVAVLVHGTLVLGRLAVQVL